MNGPEFTDVDVDRLIECLIAARREVDALKVELVRERSIVQALRAGHPSARTFTTDDHCPPFGIERPLRLVKSAPYHEFDPRVGGGLG